MKKLLALILFISSLTYVQGQTTFQGNHLLEIYGGGPNFMKFNYFGSGSSNSTATAITSIPPSGLRYAYMISNDVSIGIDVMYNSYRESYVGTDTTFVDTAWVYNAVSYVDFKSRLRIQARFNFMLPTASANLDSYIGLAVGTNNRWEKRWVDNNLIQDDNSSELVVLPVSARLCYGFRYYFNYNSALGAEVGVGGPLLSVQYTYKF